MTYDIRNPNYTPDISVNHPRHLVNVVDLSSATWNTVATHEVFTVTGMVRVFVWIVCTELITSASAPGNTTIYFISESGIVNLSYASDDTSVVGGFYERGSNSFVLAGDKYAASGLDKWVHEMYLGGLDFGYQLPDAAAANGTLEFHCIWEPLTAGASVTLGAGGTL